MANQIVERIFLFMEMLKLINVGEIKEIDYHDSLISNESIDVGIDRQAGILKKERQQVFVCLLLEEHDTI